MVFPAPKAALALTKTAIDKSTTVFFMVHLII